MVDVTSSILLLEDERNVGSTLVDRLKADGFSVTWAQSLQAAEIEIESRRFDLAILDVMLPDGSGFDFARRLRTHFPSTAILFLTAMGSPADRVRGLELGAEDYVPKPFHYKELLLRVRNGLKRARYFTGLSEAAGKTTTVGRAEIDFSKFQATRDGQTHTLTHKECALLRLFVERMGKVVSRDEILNLVWAEDEFPSTRTIDNFVMRLRRLIEADPEQPRLLVSVRGVGYCLNPKAGTGAGPGAGP